MKYAHLVKWERKAASWEAPEVTSLAVLFECIDLPQFPSAERFPCSDFAQPRPQFHIAIRPNGDRFLVDTQGSNYARYIARLPRVEGQ